MSNPNPVVAPAFDPKKDADYVFYELTRSICPQCRRVVDGHVLIRDNKVYMRKRCPDHGLFEGLVYSDAEAYTSSSKFNKPGTIPVEFSTEVKEGCPHDCGLCPDHQQHACLGIIEVNSACDMACPLCFAEAGPGFSLTLEEVEDVLDHYIRTGLHKNDHLFAGRAYQSRNHGKTKCSKRFTRCGTPTRRSTATTWIRSMQN